MRQSRLNLLVALFHTPRKYRDVSGQPMDEIGLDAAEAEMYAKCVLEAQRTRERIEQATKKGKV